MKKAGQTGCRSYYLVCGQSSRPTSALPNAPSDPLPPSPRAARLHHQGLARLRMRAPMSHRRLPRAGSVNSKRGCEGFEDRLPISEAIMPDGKASPVNYDASW